jgi:hypothetical protein
MSEWSTEHAWKNDSGEEHRPTSKHFVAQLAAIEMRLDVTP